MKLVYFASLRRQIGIAEEQLPLPPDVTTLGALVDWLGRRGAPFQAVFGGSQKVMAAVNQDYAGPEKTIGPEDEIAFFPPVTGG